MATCEEIKTQILQYLMQDIEAHEAGRYDEIGQGERIFYLDEYDEKDKEGERLSLVLNLWDRWQDSRNHDWGYYRGIEENDWPIIARQLYQGIVEEWEPERMADTFLFDPPSRVSLWQRIKNYFDNK